MKRNQVFQRTFFLFLTLLCSVRSNEGTAQVTPPRDNQAVPENELTLSLGSPQSLEGSDQELSETSGTVQINDRSVPYQATAGTLPLRDGEGKTTARIFFTHYHCQAEEGQPRPLTFCFNGGPGSSSVWLHLGMLGPRMVRMEPDAKTSAPPYQLQPNPDSLLDRTDLVFVDPVGTGYSRTAGEATREQFHGYDEDLASMSEFIRLFTTRFNRWQSPLFLLGESYGCLRVAGLASRLQQDEGLELCGMILVSSVINFQTIRFDTGNDLPFILFLPSYSATAWYHGLLDPELQRRPLREVVSEAREFAAGDYARALFDGQKMSGRQRQLIARRIAALTGLTPGYVQQADLRISMSRFAKELLRSRRRTTGRLDSRFLGIDRDSAGDRYEFDSSYSAILGPFTASMYSYLRNDLQVVRDDTYEILSGDVRPWSYASFENRYVDSSESLRSAMTRNPSLRVFIANGYYDLATPFMATEYSFDHLGLPRSLHRNIRMEYYEAGHMMYIHTPSLRRMKKHLAEFYSQTLDPGPANEARTP